jgi:hypothetical protein
VAATEEDGLIFPNFASSSIGSTGSSIFGRILNKIRFAVAVGYPQLQFTIGSRVAGSENSDYVVSFAHKA